MKQSKSNLRSNLLIFCVLASLGTGLAGLYFSMQERWQNQNVIDKEQNLEIQATQKQVPGIAKYIQLVNELEQISKGKLTAHEITEVAKIIIIECNINSEIGLTPDMIMALMERESNFNPNAISYAHAYGLMQVTRAVCELHLPELGYGNFSKSLVLDPIVNVQLGIKELVRLRKYWIEHGTDSWIVTMTSYFWGVKNTWALLTSKKRSNLPSLEYGKGILDLATKWKEKGLG
jgi:hypothetical protein